MFVGANSEWQRVTSSPEVFMGSSARCSIPERMLFGEVESEQMGLKLL